MADLLGACIIIRGRIMLGPDGFYVLQGIVTEVSQDWVVLQKVGWYTAWGHRFAGRVVLPREDFEVLLSREEAAGSKLPDPIRLTNQEAFAIMNNRRESEAL